MRELAERGYAFRVPDAGTIYRTTPEGHALLGEIMRRNGERWIQWRASRS